MTKTIKHLYLLWALTALAISLFVLITPKQAAAQDPIPTIEVSGTPMPPEKPIEVDITPITATETLTVTVVPSATIVPTETITPTVEPSLTPNPPVFLPFVLKLTPAPYVPTVKVLYCSNPGSLAIPDNNSTGVADTIQIDDLRKIGDLDISLDIVHPWVGDLIVSLTHQETGKAVTLIDRPGLPASSQGCGNPNIHTILDDEISEPVENKCAASPAAISGIYIPEQPLSSFNRDSIKGNWTLNVSDNFNNDTGSLQEWCLIASISENPEPPTPTPPPPDLPSRAKIGAINGQSQALPLDCESRSAVDWAGYFGNNINELKFYNNLPHSNNPDIGFVGNVYGIWGQIPPNDYGVHAEPVAALLRSYGLEAYAHRPLSWTDLRAEIAAGRPVMVWIVGSPLKNGIPEYYTPSDGLSTIVARYEHTVVVTGYTENNVSYLNGGTIYSLSMQAFLDSWSVLGNMAITARP
jgi:uncharacterized protein YvpB/subtilisin-like proprotein convertase family protein